MNPVSERIAQQLAKALSLRSEQVRAFMNLRAEGATVPFIARYRKEVTGGLDDTQLRQLEEEVLTREALEARRATIINSITGQGKMTPALAQALDEADTQTRLEDLYLPYKPRRVSKGTLAIEAGLLPVAEALWAATDEDPAVLAAAACLPDTPYDQPRAVLEAARFIWMERWAEHADLLALLRTHLQRHGVIQSRVIAGQETAGAKFSDYFAHEEPLAKIPGHRALALFRGRAAGCLGLSLVLPDPESGVETPETLMTRFLALPAPTTLADQWRQDVLRWTWRVKCQPHFETELFAQLRQRAEDEAIEIFARNLKQVLMSPPAGPRVTLGIDPGLRTGCKVAVVDTTGKLLAHDTLFPHAPRKDWSAGIQRLHTLCAQYAVDLIAVGNGTASRETEQWVRDLLAQFPAVGATLVSVSEAGASVYSASALAAQEFPDLDVSFRGAVSIARRLQDPLAELVKIEPKAIGVGQYQHDVNPQRLARSLDAVVEDCVNAVGVDVNRASVPLLARIAGLGPALAEQIVRYRDERGPFLTRDALKAVPRLGARTFEQAAGFLRIAEGDEPLDATGVHPEAYPVVQRVLADLNCDLRSVMGDPQRLQSVQPARYVDERFGLPTITDVLRELEKPGRDPRPEFRVAQFDAQIQTLHDLRPGQILEGVVTNVTAFGAFVDIGVHQDGLVHVSALSDRFVSAAHEAVSTGDIIRVKVVSVDIPRQRIALTARLKDPAVQSTSSASAPAKKTTAPPPAKTGRLGALLQQAGVAPTRSRS